MARITKIEDTAASGLPQYNNLKLIVRSRPRYLDTQMEKGTLRFAIRRGFNFSGIMPDNQSDLAEDVQKDETMVQLTYRPAGMTMGTLIRIGFSETIGELHHVQDTIEPSTIEITEPLLDDYSADDDSTPKISLLGTPCSIFTPMLPPDDMTTMNLESWYQMVPGDILLISRNPDVLESLEDYEVKRADLVDTRDGLSGTGEPPTVYRYQIELNTKTGLLPFVPEEDLVMYLKALPLYYLDGWGDGDLDVPDDTGPALLDAFFGSLLESSDTETVMGIRTWDSFGKQANLADTGNQQWERIEKNHLFRERPILSDSLLFWQRITGNFQYQKSGYFNGELDDEGKFTFSSDLFVPKWPTDRDYGWVIPVFSKSAFRAVVKYEPQAQQEFEIPADTLTYIRPKVFEDPDGAGIDRLIISFLGSPNSRVEIRDWQYDGSTIESVSYYILGTGETFGQDKWLAGGFSVKPLFFNLSVLKARYSDGVSKYNAGHIYV